MLKIQSLKSPHPFAANTYLLTKDSEVAIVDPTTPYDANTVTGKVKYILLTHEHFDHILEIDSWVDNTGATVIATQECTKSLSDPMRNCYKLYNGTDNGYFGVTKIVSDGDFIPFGDGNIRVMQTPGHTAGSAIFIIDNIAFVGDTVFEGGGYGRYDLPTGSFVMLRESINKILRLDRDLVMYPGHGGQTTLQQFIKDFRG